MSDLRQDDFGVTPTLEVRVFRDDVFVQRVLCETEEDAVAAVEAWEEEPGVKCEVDDLSAERHDVDVLEVEWSDFEEYPAWRDPQRGQNADR